MKKTIFVLLVITIMFIVSGCPEVFLRTVYSIKIQNNTKYAISYYKSFIYPDTSINTNKPILKWSPPQDYSYLDSNKKWEKVLVHPNDTVSIFILSKNLVDIYNWDEIVNNYLILKRYDLSLSDLQYLKWKVTYPPTEEMKNMRMYPPYEQ